VSAQALQAAATVLEAMDGLFRRRRRELPVYVTGFVREEMPAAPQARVDELAQQEMVREAEFQRKARARMAAELPLALAEADPAVREARVRELVEREKRFLRQRAEASASRVVAALEVDLLRELSPDGAYWQLSPLVREHTLDCIAMAGKFHPWAVLEHYHPQLHTGCQCRLLSKSEAVRARLMNPDDAPVPPIVPPEVHEAWVADCVGYAEMVERETRLLQESMAPEEYEGAVYELETLRLQEAQRRFGKGTVKGGEFMPKRGAARGPVSKAALAKLGQQLKLADMVAPVPPSAPGRDVTIQGQDRRIPQAAHWEERIGGVRYTSPAGDTSLYRDGVLIGWDHPDLATMDPVPYEPPQVNAVGAAGEGSLAAPSTPVEGIPDYTGVELRIPGEGKGSAGGSQGAKIATDASGGKWLVKTYQGSQDRVATELLANAVYRAMGANAANAGMLKQGERVALTYPLVDGETREQKYGEPDSWTPEGKRAMGEHYMTDALVGNWDFVGLTRDNVLWDDAHTPTRIDQGGTFQYRAMGQAKPFGPIPTEVWTMRSPKGQGFGAVDVSEGSMRAQARRIGETLTDDRVDQLVDEAPFQDAAMREEIRDALKARVQWMRDLGDGTHDLPRPLAGAEARKRLSEDQRGLDVLPEEHSAVDDFVSGGHKAVNGHLRGGGKKADTPEGAGDTIKGLDSLLKRTRLDDDVYGYVAVDPAKLGDPEKLVGRTLRDDGYASAALNSGTLRDAPGYARVTIPAGSRALYAPGLEGLEDTSDATAVILPRGTRMKVVAMRTVGGELVAEMVVV
jgi:hypothetical protein